MSRCEWCDLDSPGPRYAGHDVDGTPVAMCTDCAADYPDSLLDPADGQQAAADAAAVESLRRSVASGAGRMAGSPSLLVELDVHDALMRLLTAARRWRDQTDPDSPEYAAARERLADAVDGADAVHVAGWDDHVAAVRPLGVGGAA